MTERKALHLHFGGSSIKGMKESNDDAFTAFLSEEHSVRKFKGAAACIADGASCSDQAQLASQTAVTNFISDYFSTPDFWTVKQSASRVISSINSWLHHQGQQAQVKSNGLITTFSALIIKSHTAHIFHAGDSRIYLLRDGELECLTNDHRYIRGSESYLTRALGISSRLELDYRSIKVKLGDRFILTTDGVHETLSHKELLSLLNNDETSDTASLENSAKALTNIALNQGSDDNLSCLIVDVVSLPQERLEEIYNDLTELTIPPALTSGHKIDHFEIIRELHKGTRSHVYLARDKNEDALRILKMPSINAADDIEYLDSFAREQWIGRRVSHAKLMKIFEPPQNTQFLYHVCEYIEGQTLRQWMIDNPKPDLDTVRDMIDEMIAPVRALHRDKMVHRDLKPENFIIDREGRIKLIDYGTVLVSGIQESSLVDLEQAPVGDAGYIAPECLVDKHASPQSDLFSIASIVYEMICGELPYKVIQSNRHFPNSYDKWQYTPLNTQSQAPSHIPAWVDKVLKKALAPKPHYRYEAMSEFQSDIRSPSREILQAGKFEPLIERNPLRFWQITSGLLFVMVVVQAVVFWA